MSVGQLCEGVLLISRQGCIASKDIRMTVGWTVVCESVLFSRQGCIASQDIRMTGDWTVECESVQLCSVRLLK